MESPKPSEQPSTPPASSGQISALEPLADITPSRSTPRRKISPVLATGLLGIALVVWGGIYTQQRREATVQQHVTTGLQYLRAGDSRMENEFRQVLEEEPNNLQALGVLSDYYLKAKRYPQALEMYQKWASLEPDTPLIHVNIAQAALGARNMDLAYKSTQEALKQDPNSIEALKLAVTISEMMGQKEKRTEYLRRWRKLDPNNPEAVAKVADDYIVKSRYAVARPLVEHLIKLVPEFGPAYSMRGHILIELNPTSRICSKPKRTS
jgi:Tfp pilus assembly protein PilF